MAALDEPPGRAQEPTQEPNALAQHVIALEQANRLLSHKLQLGIPAGQ